MRNRYITIIVVLVIVNLILVWQVYAGTPDSPDFPDQTSSYSLEDIYNRLDTGAAGAPSTFTEPSSGPGTGTGHTLNEIYELIGPRAPVPKTGAGDLGGYTEVTGEDRHADMQKGVAWPVPRFITSTTGIVTDTLTGLIWLKNANCLAFFPGDSTAQNNRSWSNAILAANSLASGYCGLADGSSAGDWRLPNVRELNSLAHYGYSAPAVPNTAGTGQWSEGYPFTGIQPTSYYWSSTTASSNTSYAWQVNMYYGQADGSNKTTTSQYVWPVRGGQ